MDEGGWAGWKGPARMPPPRVPPGSPLAVQATAYGCTDRGLCMTGPTTAPAIDHDVCVGRRRGITWCHGRHAGPRAPPAGPHHHRNAHNTMTQSPNRGAVCKCQCQWAAHLYGRSTHRHSRPGCGPVDGPLVVHVGPLLMGMHGHEWHASLLKTRGGASEHGPGQGKVRNNRCGGLGDHPACI